MNLLSQTLLQENKKREHTISAPSPPFFSTVALFKDSKLEKEGWKHSSSFVPYSYTESPALPAPSPAAPQPLPVLNTWKSRLWSSERFWDGESSCSVKTKLVLKPVGISGHAQRKAPKTGTNHNLHLPCPVSIHGFRIFLKDSRTMREVLILESWRKI